MTSNSTLVGWHDPPGSRGTFDIIKTCVGTVFLLCWSTVPANVPSQKAVGWQQYRGKVALFLWSILGPDFAFIVAMGQLNAALTAKRRMREEGKYENWTLRQSFFVNMGGLHLRLRNSDGSCPETIPVTCSQLLELESLTEKRINVELFLDRISVAEIDDRNKLDALARFLAIVQSIWFTVESLGRVAQGLFLTTLEITTLAFVVAMTACTVCWWKKPIDITRPVVVDVDVSLQFIIAAAAAKGKPHTAPHGRTPLSFIDRNENVVGKAFHHYVQILRDMRLVSGANARPEKADSFPSVEFQTGNLSYEFIPAAGVFLYSAIFMAAWNYDFPTHTELILWRIASVYTLAAAPLAEFIAAVHYEPVHAITRKWVRFYKPAGNTVSREAKPEVPSTELEDPTRLQNKRNAFARCLTYMRNNSPDQDPNLEVSFGFYIPFTLVSALYCFARLLILVEEFVELRALPPSAYQTVNYGPYSPIL